MLNCSMPVTTKNVQVLAPKSHLILQLKKKKSKRTFETEICSVFYNMHILHWDLNENFISCIMTLEYCIRHKLLSL